MRLLHQLDDLRERSVGADLGGGVAEAAAFVDRRADHRVAGDLLHRHRLARQHRLIDLRAAFGNQAIDRDLVTRLDHDGFAHQHRRGGHLGLGAAAQHGGHRRSQVHQRPDRLRRAGARSHFQPVAEQDEDQKHRCRFIEDFAVVEERGADAEEVAGADGKHDQRGHVRDFVACRSPSSQQEGPARIGDSCGSNDEQKNLAIHAERRRELAEHAAHRRVGEHRDGKEQCHEEAVAHVTRHVLHRHAGCMPHVVHHVARVACRWLGMPERCIVARMRIMATLRRRRRRGRRGVAQMRGKQLAATVVAAIRHPLADLIDADPRFVIADGCAAGHVVHVDRMDAGQRRELPLDPHRAQR